MEKMIQISKQLENKDYKHISLLNDPAEIEFLRHKEADLLFKHGLSYDASRDLQTQMQSKRSLEQLENEHVHTKQMELGTKKIIC